LSRGTDKVTVFHLKKAPAAMLTRKSLFFTQKSACGHAELQKISFSLKKALAAMLSHNKNTFQKKTLSCSHPVGQNAYKIIGKIT